MTTLQEQKRAYWRNHIDNWKQSGLSQRKYCEQAKISLYSFSWWHGRGLKSEPQKTAGRQISFVPVIPKEANLGIQNQLVVTLILPNQTKVLLPTDMANNDLIHLVKALGGIS